MNINKILVFVEVHWGEIDYILPVLTQFKEKESDCKIFFVFKTKALLDQKINNKSLAKSLEKIADKICVAEPENKILNRWYNLLKWRPFYGALWLLDLLITRLTGNKSCFFFSARLHPTSHVFRQICPAKEITFFFKDYSAASPCKAAFERKCINAKKIMYPHGPAIRIPKNVDSKVAKNSKPFYNCDLLLAPTEYNCKWWENFAKMDKGIAIGFPRYDKWWIDRQINPELLSKTPESNFSKNAKHTFVFYSRHLTMPEQLTYDTYKYLIETAVELVLNQPDSVIIIKAHPREDLSVLKKILEKYDSKRWMISSLAPLQVAFFADFVISMWSSCILDALALEKPVIEYFQFKTPHKETVTFEDGHIGSSYEYCKVSVRANTKEELNKLIDDYFSTVPYGDSKIWKNQKEQYKKVCKFHENSSAFSVDLILRLRENGTRK